VRITPAKCEDYVISDDDDYGLKVRILAKFAESVLLGVQIKTSNFIPFLLQNRLSNNISGKRFSMGWVDHFGPLI